MIDNRWNNYENKTSINYWNFTILKLSNEEKQELASFCLEAIGIKIKKEIIPDVVRTIDLDKDFLISSELIDIETVFNRDVLYKTLECILLSEFKLDAILLLPPEMRHERLEVYSKALDVEIDFIIKVDKFWRSFGAV